MFRLAGSSALMRSRWAGIGAAVAVSLGAGGMGWIAHAADSAPSSLVSITPCRLFDTRSTETVGARNTPLVADETFVRQVTGTNGNCTIPAGATAISYNLTIPDGLDGYLTIYPADAARPTASTINPVTGQGVKVNGGVVGLSATGAIALYSLRGPIDALLDITGYFIPGTGAPGARGLSAWDVIPSGQTVTGTLTFDSHSPGALAAATDSVGIDLPGVAPVDLTEPTVNLAAGSTSVDADPECNGTAAAPTAPAGKVCIYLSNLAGLDEASIVGTAGVLPSRSFFISFDPIGAVGDDEFIFASWAYTAP
jgi:hypothetical protein